MSAFGSVVRARKDIKIELKLPNVFYSLYQAMDLIGYFLFSTPASPPINLKTIYSFEINRPMAIAPPPKAETCPNCCQIKFAKKKRFYFIV